MKYFMCFILIVYIVSNISQGHIHRNVKKRQNSNINPYNNENYLQKFICEQYEKDASKMCKKSVMAEWNHLVDIKNRIKEEISLNVSLETAQFDKNAWNEYFKDVNIKSMDSPYLRRQMIKLSNLGHSALDPHKVEALTYILNNMTAIYSTAKICPYNNPGCNLICNGITLEKEIDEIMAKSTDYDELLYTWIAWREATGPKIRLYFDSYVDLSNEAARANNFTDTGEMWRNEFETVFFEREMMNLWYQIEPLYNEMHMYVYHKLRMFYKIDLFDDQDDLMIPAHLLGNMWGQTWSNLGKLVRPFPHASQIDVTAQMKKQNYSVLKMFDTANNFYKSLGMPSASACYDVKKGAMIERPKNREVLCHASAFDFCDGNDFRIKMCTQVTFQDFIIIHHEMGHIQYYMQYKHLPIILRTGANPGFHEAIGDTIALSVSTPRHLKRIGLIDKNYHDTYEADINALMDMALERVAFLPFGLLVDKWRWDVFSDKVERNDYNSHWWRYREMFQKIKSPVPRSDLLDFDPGGKFHIIGDSQYISYFFAHILEFEIYKSLCQISGQYIRGNEKMPLHRCDFYNSKAAGQLLMNGLKLGGSKHWSYMLHQMTGSRKLTGDAILEYFDPLYKYLVCENNRIKNKK